MKPGSGKSAPKKAVPNGMRQGNAGHPHPGAGQYAGSKTHGPHSNVVNAASHAEKMRGC